MFPRICSAASSNWQQRCQEPFSVRRRLQFACQRARASLQQVRYRRQKCCRRTTLHVLQDHGFQFAGVLFRRFRVLIVAEMVLGSRRRRAARQDCGQDMLVKGIAHLHLEPGTLPAAVLPADAVSRRNWVFLRSDSSATVSRSSRACSVSCCLNVSWLCCKETAYSGGDCFGLGKRFLPRKSVIGWMIQATTRARPAAILPRMAIWKIFNTVARRH